MLFLTPVVVAFTVSEMAHELLAGTPPPERPTEVELAAAIKIPPQLFVTPGVVATCRPAGNASVNVRLLSATVLGLLIEKLN